MSTEILRDPTITELCTTAVSSTISAMEGYVKKAGKTVSAESVYPLLHETIQPFVIIVMRVLDRNGSKKNDAVCYISNQENEG